jgi:chalcone isomerase-like protein
MASVRSTRVCYRWFAVAAAMTCGLGIVSAEMVGVPNSAVQFPTPIQSSIAGNQYKMRLTGTALRTRVIFSVYAVGSYVQDGLRFRTAEELAAADKPKQLHLVMERDVDGPDMADAFKKAIRANYPEPTFNNEVMTLTEKMKGYTVHKGDHVWLTHVPGVGMHCHLAGKTDYWVKGVPFARAVWEIYLGKNSIGDDIKRGLTSRL